ncbi:COP1-interacting protein 4.1 [Arabidopsis thaliana]|uniref:COP1-interacting protein 4.1 n=1 Tax=Arabidopsis thaliana TaxID=3702 RepID=A0A1P8B9C4_ARATH|nr:COP1-interacting protein 4.1 [Arabidopsis thaliana]ANM68159.1 COP1-interacting protein 4.1 [Arabidopsis thaliana]|eukprot:NP_001329936.1 COP1-interacting protein 4.1 [Arabidopsis thaliana]
MANRETDSSPEIRCVFVETNLDTRLALPVHKDEIISDFKDKVLKEHKQVFPEIGEINISAMKVKRRREFYHFSESLNVCKAFDGISTDWFMYIDAVRVDKGKTLAIMDVDQNLELVEKKEEIPNGKNTKDLTIGEGLETQLVEKKTRKRRIVSSGGKTSRKKSKDQSVVAATTQKVQGEVASQSCAVSPREKLDVVVTGADIESGEMNNISMGENRQTSVADRLLEEKNLTVNSELVDGQTSGVVKEVLDNQTVKGALEKLDDLTGAIEQDLETGEITADIVMIDQEKGSTPVSELVDGQITSQDDERGEGRRLAPSALDNLQTAEVVTNADNQLEASSGMTTGPATEKKRKRTKGSKDHIKQSTAAATTNSRKIVNEINELPGNGDCGDATSKSLPIPERETLQNPLVEAIQKETELGVKTVEDVGTNNMETDTLVSHPENHLVANSELTSTPVTEKKKRQKKSSKDQINLSATAATATTASREIVNEINGAPGNVDRVDATSESCLISQRENLGKENEIGEKIKEDVGSGKAIPSSADNIQTDKRVSYPDNQLEVSSGLTTGPTTEKKKRQKKSSKNDINKSTAATTTSKIIVNEREKVSGSIDCVDATSESIPNSKGEKLSDTVVDARQNGNEMGDILVDKVGSGEATLIGADKIQAASDLHVAGMASTPHAFVQESKTLDHIGKVTDSEHEVPKERVAIDADQAKSVKSTKKKSSRKAKTPAKEDTLVDSGAQNVEPIKVVDGEGHDNVIRNVLDSLQQRNEAEENMEKSGKKSSKRSKKKDSLNIVEEAQVLSVEVNNVAQEEASPINNPKDTDALFTPAKKNTESNASPLKKIIEVTDNTEDINRSMQVQKENAGMGDNIGSSQKDDIVGGANKQDQVTGGTKSKKEKKSLDLHPGGSIDGSMKMKETKGRVQPSSSGTSQLQSMAKNDRSGSKVDLSDAPMKGTVNNKKEAVKKSSKSVTVNKSKMNVNNKEKAVKKISNSVTANKSTTNFFKDAEEDESKTTTSDSTKAPSDSSSDNDSDVTSSMHMKQGNNLSGGTNRLSGSLQDIVRSSKSYKAAKLTASQSQSDAFDDESLAKDVVPDSQAVI